MATVFSYFFAGYCLPGGGHNLAGRLTRSGIWSRFRFREREHLQAGKRGAVAVISGRKATGKRSIYGPLLRRMLLPTGTAYRSEARRVARNYIGGRDLTTIIRTNMRFGSAELILDEGVLENHSANVVEIRSAMQGNNRPRKMP